MCPEAYAEMAKMQGSHWWFQGRQRLLATILDMLALQSKPRILEIGCGTGGNLELLQRFGDVAAVEADDGARAYASRFAQLPVLKGALPYSLPPLDRKFDVICLFDVLEHIEPDIDALRALRPLLAVGGRIVVTVPAYQWLWSAHDEKLHHKRRYTLSRLIEVSKSAHFAVARGGYFNTLLFPVAAVSRLLSRAGIVSSCAGDQMPPEFVNTILRGVFESEAPLLRKMRLPFGVSLYGILEPLS